MRRSIILLGTTLALEAVAAALAYQPGIDLRCVAGLTNGPPSPDRIPPQAVIFDLTSGLPAGTLAAFDLCGPALFLGLDLEGQRAVAFSGEPTRVATVGDLIGILLREG